MTPDTTSIDRREHSEGDIPGGFPLEDEPPVTNGTHDEGHVGEQDAVEENSPEEQREISEAPTQTQGETPEASPPPTPAESRAESISLSIIRDATLEPSVTSRMSTPASISPRKGSYRKPVLQHRTHPLKKRHDLEQKLRHMRELWMLKRAGGYSQDERTFRNYLSYKEQLEAFFTATDKKLPPPPAIYGQDSIPPLPSSTYLHRAVQNARRTLESPRPVIPNFNTSDAIARRIRERDEEIERRLRPKLPESLPTEDEQTVQKSITNRSFLAKAAREQVEHKDLLRLKPGAWLNDEIINFYGAMISERAAKFEEEKAKGKDKGGDDNLGDPWKVHVFSTYFLAKLQDMGYEKAKLNKWTKKVDIFSKDLVLIPCNLGNSHWTCAAINFRQKRIEYYDSMSMDRPSIRQALRTYLDKEHRDKKSAPFDWTDWTDFFAEESPQQENGYDCGVFVCQTMENLSRGVPVPFDFTQRNMPYLRRRMILEITKERLPVKRL